MQVTTAMPQAEYTQGSVSGVPGGGHVDGRDVLMSGDGTSQTLRLDGLSFERLLAAIEMRQLAFEPKTHAFRPHTVPAAMVMQKIDRLHSAILSLGDPAVEEAAMNLRDIAEMSDTIAWTSA